jgi:hypothetical protein
VCASLHLLTSLSSIPVRLSMSFTSLSEMLQVDPYERGWEVNVSFDCESNDGSSI